MTRPQFFGSRFFVIVLLLAATLPAAANTIHVPADQPTIQAAVDGAANGDTILVSDGTYKENIDFKGKAITLKSINGPATTIIDGGALDSVVRFATNEGPSSVLDGFTIRNGLAGGNAGSGILINNSSPTITNNTITGNAGCDGLGIAIIAGSPLVQGNNITNNSRTSCSGGNGGGGILIIQLSTARIINNTISNNTAGDGVGGGGISLFAAGTPIIRGNVITGNSVQTSGGGIGMVNDSDPVITDNVITGNTASMGGGIATLVPSGANGPTIVNNTFASNSAPQGGSELYFSGFPNQTQFLNNIFFGYAGQIAVDCDTSYSSQAPIFKFNDTFSALGTTLAGSCSSENGSNGNISVDPLFVNSASDFHLQSTSPVIDAGSNSAPSLPQQDIAGNDRILDGNGDCIATIDMGAYEFARPSSLTFNPNSLVFPDEVVGSTSTALPSMITNNAASATTVCSFTVSGDFVQSNTCGSSIASKASCAVNVTFTPIADGARSGLLRIITNDAGSPQFIALSGKGVIPAATLSVPSLNFNSQLVSTISSPQSVTLNNTGDGSLSITNIAVAGDFSQTNTCGNSVAPGAACSFNVTFAPKASGNRAGTLTVTDNATGSPHTVTLTGSASDFSITAASSGSTSASVTAGNTATYNLQVAPQNGFNGVVSLSCASAPSEATCTVTPASVTPNGSAVPFTVSIATTAPSLIVPRAPLLRVPPLGPFSVATLLLFVIALYLRSLNRAGALCPRRVGYLLPLVLVVYSAIVFAGCGGGSSTPKNPGTPRGAYTLTVTGNSNGVPRTLTLNLNVN